MSLKEVLAAFVAHRREVLERRSRFRLEKIAARLEVLEGYLVVFLNLDKVIKIIRTEDEPKPKLMKAFSLTEVQAEAILNMRLRSLRKLEEMEIRGEHDSSDQGAEGTDATAGLRKLKSERLIEELKAIDAKFGLKTALGKRRTEIAKAAEVAEMTALAEHVEEHATGSSASRSPWSVRQRAGCARSRAIRNSPRTIKYREGDRARFWFMPRPPTRS